MSLFDDDKPKKPLAHEIGADISLLSVDELNARIRILEEEIARLAAEAEKKTASCSVAEGLFRK